MVDKFRVIEGGGEKRDMAQSMLELGREARRAARQLALAPRQRKNAALMVAAGLLRTSVKDVLEANARDMEAVTAANASKANLDRLLLTEARVEAMAKGLEDIAALPDPVGRVLATAVADWFRQHAATMDTMLASYLRTGGEVGGCSHGDACGHDHAAEAEQGELTADERGLKPWESLSAFICVHLWLICTSF
jgi:hypothetical protein